MICQSPFAIFEYGFGSQELSFPFRKNRILSSLLRKIGICLDFQSGWVPGGQRTSPETLLLQLKWEYPLGKKMASTFRILVADPWETFRQQQEIIEMPCSTVSIGHKVRIDRVWSVLKMKLYWLEQPPATQGNLSTPGPVQERQQCSVANKIWV